MGKSNEITTRTIFNIRLIFIVSLVVLICITVVVYLSTKDIVDDERDISESYKELQKMEKLSSLIVDAESSRRGYFITGQKEFVDVYQNTLPLIDSLVKHIRVSKSLNPLQMIYIDTLLLYITQRIDFLSRGIDLQEKRGTNYTLHKPLIEKGQEVHDKIIDLTTKIINEEKEDIQQRSDVIGTAAEYSLFILFGGTFISIVLLSAVYLYLEKKIAKIIYDPDSHIMTREELESVVRDRTAEIAGINQRMNKEMEKQKKTEQMLKELERDYRGLFEQAHDAIMIFKPEDEIVVEVNERACGIYKIPKEKFIGLSLKSISKNVPETEKYVKHTLEHGYCYNFQAVHYKSDGTEMLIESNASLVNYENRKMILSINRDITDRILGIPVTKS